MEALSAATKSKILESIDPAVMFNLIATDEAFANLYSDDLMWKNKVIRDYGHDIRPPAHTSWFEYYLFLSSKDLSRIAITVGGQITTTIWIKRDTPAGIARQIREHLPNVVFKGLGLVQKNWTTLSYHPTRYSWNLKRIDLFDTAFIELTNLSSRVFRLLYNNQVYFFWWSPISVWGDLVTFVKRVDSSISIIASRTIFVVIDVIKSSELIKSVLNGLSIRPDETLILH